MRSNGLGTFGGVFTPSVLTILGIILFLRHGWVVGNGGLWISLALIAVAHSVSILTSISLAAIATNRRVRGGGDYYLISRSLGPEFGGSLGLVLFLAQSISVGFYCFGFGEAMSGLLAGWMDWGPVAFAMFAALLLFALALAGADWATRFQLLIMAIMGSALVSFLIGASGRADPEILAANLSAPSESPGFWALFAVFFPAVTGFTQGVSMSGDLADPARSLPRGTFAAVATSLVAYTGTALLFAAGAPLESLRADYRAFETFSALPALFHAGVIAATLSSALASFLGAPRILQALARDGIFPWLGPFSVGAGPSGNPRRAVVLTGAIALTVLVVGDLNGVAGVISMFFLISYGLLNWATWVEAHGASPNFRPRFRLFDARVPLAGAVLCLGAMLAIDLFSGLAAIGVMVLLYRHLRSRPLSVSWADSRPAYHARQLRELLGEIDRTPVDEWTWLPNLLVCCEDSDRRDLLARFGATFVGGSGLTTILYLETSEGDLPSAIRERRAAAEKLREEIDTQGIDAIPLAVTAPDARVALTTVLETWGIGPVRLNTVLLDWIAHLPEESDQTDPRRFARQIQSIRRHECHALVLAATSRQIRDVDARPVDERRIDVWWWEDSSSRLGLLLAWMMTRSDFWEESTIRLLVPCEESEERKQRAHLEGVLRHARIDAEVETVVDCTSDRMKRVSADASMVFFRIDVDGMTMIGPFGDGLEDLVDELPVTCMVAAASGVRLSEPERDAPEPEPPREAGSKDPAHL